MSIEEQRALSGRHLRRIAGPVAVVTALVIISVVASILWIGKAMDREASHRQMEMVLASVDATVNQLAQEQEVIAVWDDMLLEARKSPVDRGWMDENVGEWLHRLFDHDVIFVLDPHDQPIYAAVEGKGVPGGDVHLINWQLRPVVDTLRGRTHEPSMPHDRLPGQPVSRESYLRSSAKSLHATRLMVVDGRPAAASVMQLLPHSDALRRDAPQNGYLLVSVRYLDGVYMKELSRRSLIEGARFSLSPNATDGETAVAMRGDRGEKIGYMIWRPERPGKHMLSMLGPVAAVTLGMFALVMAMMAVVLARSQARLEKTVDNLRISEAEAVEQRRVAEVASLAKSDFLATMSHEIRTPMNAVVSAAHFLSQGDLSDAQRDHVNMLQDASSVLLSLLNDVLDLSRIEAGKLVLEAAPFALAKEARGVIALWEPRAVDKEISLDIEVAGDLPQGVVLDQLRVKQILFNLLSNAIKFTETGGVILKVFRVADSLVFEVEDSGIGISPEGLERVFDAFEQAESGTARRFGGTGLGLAISRRLAELMGGSLTAASVEGWGSVFRLALPLVEAQVGEADVQDGEEEEVSLEGLKVLVAEDHPVNRRVVQLLLEPAGIDLTFAEDGVEAVEAAQRQVFDVILMDMQMPRMDGLEATAKIHAEGLNTKTPVIALTANAMPQHREAWRAVGVETLVAKPIDPQQLAVALITAAAGYGGEPRARAA